MPMSKLTLNIDEKLIHAAKAAARARKTSLSKLVAKYLDSILKEGGDDFFEGLHRELLAKDFKGAPDRDDDLRRRHVNRKYR